MPYSKGDENLPDNVKKMDAKMQDAWIGAWNGSHKSCMAKDGADAKQCETSAFAIANAAVNKSSSKKDFMDENTSMPFDIANAPIIDMTATTFEELDADEVVQEQSEGIQKLNEQTMTLVTNVINSELPDKPSALQRIVDGLKLKLSKLLGKKPETPMDTPMTETGMTEKKPTVKISLTVPPSNSYFTLTKDKAGDYRWFALVSNHFRDSDNPPEIFETKSHRDFVDYLDKGGKYPELWLWHTPGTKCGQADWVDFDHGFLMASGTFDKEQKDVANKLAIDSNLGVSHGYNYHYSDKEKGIIDWYRTFEISPLPKESAANPYTGIEIIRQEAKDMNPNKRTFLVGKLGEDRVRELESRPAEMEKSLKDQGIEYKEIIETPTLPAPATPASTKEIADADVKAVTESEAFKAINTALTEAKAKSDKLETTILEMGKTIKELQKTDDEKIAAVIAPKSPLAAGLKRASESKDNLVDPEKDKELTGVNAAPWLNSALCGMTK
jgi:cation transport regulator ChaB